MRCKRSKRLLALLLATGMLFGTAFSTQAETPGQQKADSGLPVWEKVTRDELEIPLDTRRNQEALTEQPAFFSQEEAETETEPVRVLIVFEEDALIDKGYSPESISSNVFAKSYGAKLEQEQKQVLDEIETLDLEGEIDIQYQFTFLANAVSAEILPGDIAAISELDGVERVVVEPVYELANTARPNMATAGEMVGSYSTWAEGYSGAGTRIAIIDTGLDTDHPSYDGGAYMAHLNEVLNDKGMTLNQVDLLDEAEIGAVLPQLHASAMMGGLTAEQLYLSEKVAFAFSYVDGDLDVTHDNDTQGDHGSHVAGIATANYYVPSADSETGYARQKEGVAGVAPDAQLLVMKVFGNAGGAYTSDYMAAIEDALLLGADAVNLSLGSASAGSTADGEAYVNEIFDKLTETDVVVSISAGNSGSWGSESFYGGNLSSDVNLDTVGSPGSYGNALTVASVDNQGTTGHVANFADAVDIIYSMGSNETLPIEDFATLDTKGTGTEYEYVYLDALGKPEDFANVDVDGKIVLVSRGEINFYEKHENAENAGAVGIFIYNNTEGSIGLNLTGGTATIPCASIYQAEALAVKEHSQQIADGVYTGKVTIYSEVRTADNVISGSKMSDFSSWGVPGDLSLKPEITAPGGNIYSTLDNGQYGLMSGTSMAAPSVAGISALVLEYIEENQLSAATGVGPRALAQSLLMSTAEPLKEDGIEYSPRRQGAGLAVVDAAVSSPGYIMMGSGKDNDGKVKAELGDDPGRTGSYTFDFTVYALDEPVFYTYDTVTMTETVADGLLGEAPHRLSPNVTITGGPGEGFYYDFNRDGVVDVADAQYFLKYINESVESDYMAAIESELDFSSDGIVDVLDVALYLDMVEKKDSALDKEGILVSGSEHITVTVNLSEADRAYLDSNFENGMYVEGYVYLNGPVPLSVPWLAFYGNWGDSSMFEPFDIFEYVITGSTWDTYSGIPYTNYLNITYAGESKAYLYVPNAFAEDSEYLPQRSALSSVKGDVLNNLNYSLIRNSAATTISVTDADTGAVYYEMDLGARYGTFFNDGTWENTAAKAPLNWSGEDAEGNPLPEGTRVNITLTALPEYYLDGSHTPGEGVFLNIPMTIDNTAPEIVGTPTVDGNILKLNVKDNQYAAAVVLVDAETGDVLERYGVNQSQAGEETELSITCPAKVVFVCVYDYAGNEVIYRVNNSGQPDTNFAGSITLSESSVRLMKNSSYKLSAAVGPVTLVETGVTWESDNENVATVDEKGIVKAVGVGTANITAKTKAMEEASGQPLTAACAVEVYELDTVLNGIIWNADSQAVHAEIKASDPASFTEVTNAAVNLDAATEVNGMIYGVVNDLDGLTSTMYRVDPSNGYQTVEIGSLGAPMTDMTYAPSANVILGTYGPYISVYDVDTQTWLGVLQAETNDSAIGIAYAMPADPVDGGDFSLILMDSGEVWYFMTAVIDGQLQFGMDTLNTNVGLSTDTFYYNSICTTEDFDYLYWSRFDGEGSELYIFDMNTNMLYNMGDFGQDIWPVVGLDVKTGGASGGGTTFNVDALLSGMELSPMTLSTELLKEAP